MNRRELEQAIKDEVEEWPGVSVKFEDSGKHPKAVLKFGDMIMRRAFGANQSNVAFPHRVISDMRAVMIQLGAERPKVLPSEEETEKRYSKPNPGKEMRKAAPVEKAAAKPTIADQLAEHPAAKEVAINQPEPEPKKVEYLGAGQWEIDADRYHADPCEQPSLSSSIAKKLIDFSPLHAWTAHPRLNENLKQTDKLIFRIGKAFHAMLLGAGAPIEVYGYADWRKDAAKADRDDSLERGCTPLLEHQHEKIEKMVRAARWQIRQREEIAYALAGGAPERVLIWQEETFAGPIWCRMMADWTPSQGRYGLDFKTTGVGAGPDAWGQRTMWDSGSDIQDAFYRRGYKAVLGIDFDAIMFAVIETDDPFAMMHHRIDFEDQEVADRDVQWAINVWGMCLKHNRWPGYPVEMAWQTKPGWRSQRSELRQEFRLDQAALEAELANLAAINEVAQRESGPEISDENPFGLPPIGTGENRVI